LLADSTTPGFLGLIAVIVPQDYTVFDILPNRYIYRISYH
jgi:hypothetical protein